MITCTKSLHCLARLTALYLTFKRCSAIIANVKMKSILLTKIEPNLQIYSSISLPINWIPIRLHEALYCISLFASENQNLTEATDCSTYLPSRLSCTRLGTLGRLAKHRTTGAEEKRKEMQLHGYQLPFYELIAIIDAFSSTLCTPIGTDLGPL